MGNMRGVGRRQARRFKNLIRRGDMNSVKVILRWRVSTGLPVGYDKNMEGSEGVATFPEETMELYALVHETSVGTTGFQRFMQVEKGDRILDFPGDTVLEGKEGLVFEFDGRTYVEKEAGRELAKSWDSTVNGVRIVRTVLVTPRS